MKTDLSTAVDQLDKKRKLTHFYRQLDAAEKRRAQATFSEYDEAVRSGDRARIAAAKTEFLRAVDPMVPAGRAER